MGPVKIGRVCLLTGGPGVGKTTIIKQALGQSGVRAGGFYTEEVRPGGQRQGFRLVTLDGESALLASVALAGPCRVGRYGVDVAALDRVGVAALRWALEGRDLVVIDEIGKMELYSASFREAVLEAVAGPKRVLATIMLARHPFADDIKGRPGCTTLEVTRLNREAVARGVLAWLQSR